MLQYVSAGDAGWGMTLDGFPVTPMPVRDAQKRRWGGTKRKSFDGKVTRVRQWFVGGKGL